MQQPLCLYGPILLNISVNLQSTHTDLRAVSGCAMGVKADLNGLAILFQLRTVG